MNSLSASEIQRYQRHLQLPQIGSAGQRQLKNTHAVIVGCGGLGAASSLYLAAAGIGQITLVDGDSVELGNLQRQITFSEKDIGTNKAIATQHRLQSLNSDIKVFAMAEHLSKANASKLIATADIVLDCSDDFNVRYLINDSCLRHAKPWVYASVFQMSGQCALFLPGEACFRCVFPNQPEDQIDCNMAGVLGVLPGILGTLQTTLAIKHITQKSAEQKNSLMLFEAVDMQLQKIEFAKKSGCICADVKQSEPTVKREASMSTNTYSVAATDFAKYANDPDYQLIDVRSYDERNNFHLGGIHIPIDEIHPENDKLDANKKLLLYCQSGMRSQLACDQLNAAGFTALSVDGGLIDIMKHRR